MKKETKLISVGDLVQQSRGLYRERIGLLTKIMLLPIGLILLGDLGESFSPGIGGFLVFVGTITSFIAYPALIFVLEKSSQFGEAYRLVLQRFWSYAWLVLLAGFVTLGGFVMLIIPGIIFGTWFAFAIYIFIIEGEKGMNALLRSKEYVRDYWWQVFGRQLLFALAALVVIALLGIIGTILAGEAGATFIVDLFSLVLAPLTVVYLYTMYGSLKSLKPEVVKQAPAGPRGFFYVSAVLGVLGLIALLVLIAVVATYFVSGGLGPNILTR